MKECQTTATLRERRKATAGQKLPVQSTANQDLLSILSEASALPSQEGNAKELSQAMTMRMQERFGYDLSNVEYRETPGMDDLGTRAMARGNVIQFSQGEFDESTSGGQALIEHELTHVVQQAQGLVRPNVADLPVNIDPALEKGHVFTPSSGTPLPLNSPPAESAPIQGIDWLDKAKYHLYKKRKQGADDWLARGKEGSWRHGLATQRAQRANEADVAAELSASQAAGLEAHGFVTGSKELKGKRIGPGDADYIAPEDYEGFDHATSPSIVQQVRDARLLLDKQVASGFMTQADRDKALAELKAAGSSFDEQGDKQRAISEINGRMVEGSSELRRQGLPADFTDLRYRLIKPLAESDAALQAASDAQQAYNSTFDRYGVGDTAPQKAAQIQISRGAARPLILPEGRPANPSAEALSAGRAGLRETGKLGGLIRPAGPTAQELTAGRRGLKQTGVNHDARIAESRQGFINRQIGGHRKQEFNRTRLNFALKSDRAPLKHVEPDRQQPPNLTHESLPLPGAVGYDPLIPEADTTSGGAFHQLFVGDEQAQAMEANPFLHFTDAGEGMKQVKPTLPAKIVGTRPGQTGKEVDFRRNYNLFTRGIARKMLNADQSDVDAESMAGFEEKIAQLWTDMTGGNPDARGEVPYQQLMDFLGIGGGEDRSEEERAAERSSFMMFAKEMFNPETPMLSGEVRDDLLVGIGHKLVGFDGKTKPEGMSDEEFEKFKGERQKTIGELQALAQMDPDSKDVFLPGACSANASFIQQVSAHLPEGSPYKGLGMQDYAIVADPQFADIKDKLKWHYHQAGNIGKAGGADLTLETFAPEADSLLSGAPFTRDISMGVYAGNTPESSAEFGGFAGNAGMAKFYRQDNPEIQGDPKALAALTGGITKSGGRAVTEAAKAMQPPQTVQPAQPEQPEQPQQLSKWQKFKRMFKR